MVVISVEALSRTVPIGLSQPTTDFSNYQDPQSIIFRSLFAIIGSKSK